MKNSRSRYRISLAGFIAALLLAVSADAATLMVTSTADGRGICPGPTCGAPQTCPGTRCTLRLAIATAAAGDTINFSLPANSTIYLNDGELLIDKSLTIDGPGANLLTVQRSAASGTPDFGIFNIAPTSFTTTLSGLTIAGGKASGGGGIRNNGSFTTTIANCVISGNLALDGYYAGGGGLYNHGEVIIINSTISGNSAQTYAGGIYNDTGMVSITNSTISGNNSGGILNSGMMIITNSTISGNSAYVFGGIYNAGRFDLDNGVIVLGSAVMIITNSTISGNNGGAINNDFGGTLRITNSTISGNNGGINGGGITVRPYGKVGPVSLKSSIIALNTSAGIPDDVIGPVTSQGFNLIGNSSGATIAPEQLSDQIGTAGSPIDPLLGPLQNNGGPTSTHALLPGSRAIDGGDPTLGCTDAIGNPIATDQRGVARPQGVRCDIGAYEYRTEILQSECFFNWAERAYPSRFVPAGGISSTLPPYYYRYYPQSNAYLAVSSVDKHIYYLGPFSNNSILDLGALSDWLLTAGCQ